MAAANRKIVRYRRPFELNIGVIIFLVVFFYLAVFLFQYAMREKIRVYEVGAGKVSNVSDYTGFILRDEVVTRTDSAGYVNYYRREEERASVGSLVYTMDESGQVASLLSGMHDQEDSISGESLQKVKSQLTAFSTGYDRMNFDEVYSVKSTLNTALLEYMNSNLLNELGDSLGGVDISFRKNYTETSGILEFYVDGYEDMTYSDLTMDLFTGAQNYQKDILTTGTLVEVDAPVYKTIHSDEWDIYIPITDADKQRFDGRSIVHVTFPGTGLDANAEFRLVIGADGQAYAELHLYKYMVRFASERYVNVELEESEAEGLKIPMSSVVSKSFYVVPSAYLTKGGDSLDDGFFREVYTSGGTGVEFVPATVYYATADSVYIDTKVFEEGTYLVMPDTNERYPVAATASLRGVYNINKGYAVFRQVDIIAETDDFYIVSKNTRYGISMYDHIVLNSGVVQENDIVY